MNKMKMLLVACAIGAGCFVASAATNMPWRAERYTMTARSMPVRQALDTFAVAQGVAVVMSESVTGVFSGNFCEIPSTEFLDRVCTMHNLTWYYDGTTVYVYAAGEIRTMLVDLRYMKAGEVCALLRELGVEDARFPIKTASNDELIMVSGPPRYVALVAELIARADKLRELRTFNEVEVRLFPLQNTWADNVSFTSGSPESSVTIRGVAQLLEEIMVSAGVRVREDTNRTDRATAQESVLGAFQPVIRPENRLNAVLVRDVTTRMPQYDRIIRQLDTPQKLVEIGVTTLEMSKEDALDWQLSFKAEGNHRGEMTGAAGQNAGNLFDPSSLGGQGLAGAFTYLGKDVNVSASLSALRTRGKARNISRTSILTLNNMAASLSDTQSYYAKVVGTEVATLEEVSAGTTLQIKPRIVEPPAGVTNQPPQIWLSMRLEDGGFETISVDSMPMTRRSSLETQAALPENESILLAGYFRDIRESAGWGIPYLRDIPFIGWVFGGSSHNNSTVQRLFILTPHVVDIAYVPQATQTVASVQALRQRNILEEEDIEDRIDRDDAVRKDREERIDERREIRHESDEESLRRNRMEREFRRQRRKDDRRNDRLSWEADFEARHDAYDEQRAGGRTTASQAEPAENDAKEEVEVVEVFEETENGEQTAD